MRRSSRARSLHVCQAVNPIVSRASVTGTTRSCTQSRLVLAWASSSSGFFFTALARPNPTCTSAGAAVGSLRARVDLPGEDPALGVDGMYERRETDLDAVAELDRVSGE